MDFPWLTTLAAVPLVGAVVVAALPSGRDLLAKRNAALPVVEGKHACHSELVADASTARVIQETSEV